MMLPHWCKAYGIAVVVAVVAGSACGGGGESGPASPAAPSAPVAPLQATFTVYHSAQGQVNTFTRSVSQGTSVTLSMSDLGVSGVDPMRFVVRRAHQGDRLGTHVVSTRDGKASFTVGGTITEFDVFVMNASNGADYACADNGDRAWNPNLIDKLGAGGTRYGTIRQAVAGEQFLDSVGTPVNVVDGPEEQLFRAVQEVNRVLNPFGVAYGHLEYVGRASSADFRAGWAVNTPMGLASYTGAWIAVTDFYLYDHYYSYHIWVHELAHVWQMAPDYYTKRECSVAGMDCLLFDCPMPQRYVALSPKGQDIMRYWTLMMK